MGHRPTPSEEEQRLRQATREAHEAIQELKSLLREAKELAANLTADYQAHHDRELKELANVINIEQNQMCADLNASIVAAREMINGQLMAGEAKFDARTETVIIRWGPGRFDDSRPNPYPEVAPKEIRQ